MNEISRPDANSAFHRMTVRDAKPIMREAVRLNLLVKRIDRDRAADGSAATSSPHHEELAAVLRELADHGFAFDPNQYEHPSDVE